MQCPARRIPPRTDAPPSLRPAAPLSGPGPRAQDELHYVRTTEYVDDQYAFNLLLWHGFRNHPGGAVTSTRPRSRVISVVVDPKGSAGEANVQAAAEDARGARRTAFGWRSGWKQLV